MNSNFDLHEFPIVDWNGAIKFLEIEDFLGEFHWSLLDSFKGQKFWDLKECV